MEMNCHGSPSASLGIDALSGLGQDAANPVEIVVIDQVALQLVTHQ